MLFNKEKSPTYQPGEFWIDRLKFVYFFILIIFFLILIRSALISIYPPSFDQLNKIAKKQYIKTIDSYPNRGSIYDRNKIPLAVSIEKYSIAINPKIFNPSEKKIKLLANILDIDYKYIKTASLKKEKYFYWLKRKIHKDYKKQISKLNINGIIYLPEQSRVYPNKNLASNLIGYVGLDNTGLSGLEYKFNKSLNVKPFTVSFTKDAKGQLIISSDMNLSNPYKSGHDMILTIDIFIQKITEKILAKAIEKSEAKSGFIMVSDPFTGDILAIANHPNFNPNNIYSINPSDTRNKALLDLYEPGSVIKPLIISYAIDRDLIKWNDKYDCKKGVYRFEGGVIHDDHSYDILNTEEIIMYSSNICIFQIAKIIGKKKLYDMFKLFGISSNDISINFPGYLPGYISNWKKWKNIRYANISFGQGFALNGAEMLRAFNIIVNGGYLINLKLIKRIENIKGTLFFNNTKIINNVISNETALKIKKVLKDTIEKGTGKRAMSQIYLSGGKTGTSEKLDLDLGGYSKDKRIASFIGFAPFKNPKITVYVVLDEPKKPAYGGRWAAPVFKEVIEKTLKYLNI